MPPLLHLPAIISEATKRHLERAYPSQSHDTMQSTQREQSVAEALHHILPARSPVSNQNGRSNQRSLPNRAVTDESLDDAFVSFIMYCNPSVPQDTDTTELRKTFRAPPRSDNKTFSTFILFELIRKLEEKEIKTWAQLAVDLGVERPDFDKGQSSQKVQQYSVRLKRWMHAMHVDAFFEYLMNKAHVYYTQVPGINEPKSQFGRDGVSAEEDLALRALLPETRPKRGRKKAEDRENDEDLGRSPAQRRRLDSPTLSEDFMLARSSFIGDTPASAHPTFHQGFDDRIAPWSATEVRTSIPDNFRWTHPNEAQTPISAYPRSAITPSNRTQMWNDGSQSAITPNKSKQRRRHGPGVSSAWTGSSSSSGSGKLRGRPPSNRSVTDGPFSTFPANPGGREVPTINLLDDGPSATPIAGNSDIPHFFPPSMPINRPQLPDSTGQGNRPSRLGLQLQVPQRQGGAVRLATPPPAGLLNGQGNNMNQNSNMQNNSINLSQNISSNTPKVITTPPQITPQAQMTPQITPNSQNFTPMMEYFTTPSTGDQETSFQHFVSFAFRQTEDTDRTNVDALESHFISEILAADWYDAHGMSIERCGIDEAAKICKQVIKNLQAESSSTEAFLINLSALAGGPLTTRLRMTKYELEGRADYECHWKMRFGSIEGDFTIRASVEVERQPMVVQDSGDGDGEASWKQRYLDLQQQIRQRDMKVGKLKRGLLDALVVGAGVIP